MVNVLAVVVVVICVLFYIAAVFCNAAAIGFDETNSDLTVAALLIVFWGNVIAIIWLCCAAFVWAIRENDRSQPFQTTAPDECADNFCACFVYVMLSIPIIWLGLSYLAATILQAIVTAENSDPGSQAFGGFVTAMNAILSLVSIPCFCCCYQIPSDN